MTILPHHGTHTRTPTHTQVKELEDNAMRAVSAVECRPASTPATTATRDRSRGRGRPRDSRAARAETHSGGKHRGGLNEQQAVGGIEGALEVVEGMLSLQHTRTLRAGICLISRFYGVDLFVS